MLRTRLVFTLNFLNLSLCVTISLSMTYAVSPACVARLFTSKTSGQSLAPNTVNGSVLLDLVRIASRLFRTLRRFLVSLNSTNGNGHNTSPLRFSSLRMPLKNKIKFPPVACLSFGSPRKFGLTHGEVKPPFLVRFKFGSIRRASLRINHDFIMSFKVANQTIHFHKSYLERVPKRYMPVYSGVAEFVDVQVTLNVRRNLQASKYYWIFTFLGRTFVFWSEHFDTMYLSEFNQVCAAYVSSFYHQIENSDKKCNVLTQKSFG